MNAVARIFAYVRPYRGLMIATLTILVIGSIVGLAGPWPLKVLIDYVITADASKPAWLGWVYGPLARTTLGLLVGTVLLMILITLIENLLSVINNYVTTKLDQKMVLDFRGDLFQHAMRLSLAFHDQKRTGPLIYAINFQADAAAGIVLAIPPLLESLLMLVGMFVVLTVLDWRVGLLTLAVLPPLYYTIGYYAKHIENRLREVKQMEEVSLSIIHEAISMLRVLVAFGREGHEFRRFRKQGETAVDARVRLTVKQSLFSLWVRLVIGVNLAVVLGFATYEILHGRLKPGDLMLVLGYITMIYKPLEAISFTLGSLQNNIVNLQMAAELLDLRPEIQDRANAVKIERARGEIEFRDVCFSYTGRTDTLTHIAFKANAGEVVAIVGPTGAGKTTLVSLIPRFYAPSSGKILIDGRDVADVTVASLRDQISMVLQEPLLFSGTIAENIRYGRLEASDNEIIKAAQDANAHEFITRLPKQYETEIGERGAQLSGGERQRICVARAFLKDAPILILDEPTSSIDSKTEAVILDALDLLMEGRTTFMIAHRLSTVRRADRILVMDQGKLLEQGTHDELIARGRLYKQLHDMQIGQRNRRARVLEATAAGDLQ